MKFEIEHECEQYDEPCDSRCPANPEYDPTPYCSYGHRSKAQCDCLPIAENE